MISPSASKIGFRKHRGLGCDNNENTRMLTTVYTRNSSCLCLGARVVCTCDVSMGVCVSPESALVMQSCRHFYVQSQGRLSPEALNAYERRLMDAYDKKRISRGGSALKTVSHLSLNLPTSRKKVY